MPKVVFEHKEVLFPRVDQSFRDTADEMMVRIIKSWPDKDTHLRWTYELLQYPDKKTADLTIRVTDPKKADISDVARMLMWLIIFGSFLYFLIKY